MNTHCTTLPIYRIYFASTTSLSKDQALNCGPASMAFFWRDTLKGNCQRRYKAGCLDLVTCLSIRRFTEYSPKYAHGLILFGLISWRLYYDIWVVLWWSHKNDTCSTLKRWGPDKMADIFQTFSYVFSLTKMFEIRIQFDWSLFLRVQLTTFLHWYR